MSYVIPIYTNWPVTIPDASLTQDGVMTSEMFATLTRSFSFDEVVVYLSTTGSDFNDGKTLETAVRTPERAFELVPAGWAYGAKIYPQPGTYVLNQSYIAVGRGIGPYASPLAIVGSYTTLASVTATANSADGTLVTFAESFSTDEYQGKWIRCTSGDSAGMRCQIQTNGVHTVSTMGAFFFGGVSIGDEFVVEECDVIIDTESGFVFDSSVLGCVGIKWVMGGTNNLINAAKWVIEGCEFDFDGTGALRVEESSALEIAVFSAFNAGWADDVNNPFDFANACAGAYFHNSSTDPIDEQGLVCNSSSIFGMYLGKDVLFSYEHSNVARVCATLIEGSEIASAGRWESVGLFDIPTRGKFSYCPADNGLTAALTLDLNAEATISMLDIDHCGADAGTGDGILVKGRSMIKILDAMAGTGNTGYGVHVIDSSQAFYDGTAAPTITGTGGDTSIGATNAQTWAATAVTGLTQSNGGGSTLNRISPLGV